MTMLKSGCMFLTVNNTVLQVLQLQNVGTIFRLFSTAKTCNLSENRRMGESNGNDMPFNHRARTVIISNWQTLRYVCYLLCFIGCTTGTHANVFLLSETNKVWNIYDDIVNSHSSLQPSLMRHYCLLQKHTNNNETKKKTISNIRTTHRKTCHPFLNFPSNVVAVFIT